MIISPNGLDSLRELIGSWCQAHMRVSDLADAEQMAEEIRRLCGDVVFQQALLQIGRKATYQGTSIACSNPSCNEQARFVSYRSRWVKTACAEAQVERAYYHCGACKTGQIPWDQAQGLNDRIYTPALKATVADVMGRLSYGEGVDLLDRLGVVKLEESTAEDIVLEVGERLRKEEAQRIEDLKAQSLQALATHLMCDSAHEGPSSPQDQNSVRAVQGKRLYAAMDATTAHIGGGWHNVQVGVLFTVRADKDDRDTLWERSYVSARTNVEAFGWKLKSRAAEWNQGSYTETVFLGDGAPCNWNQASLHFPSATQILDIFHVSEHLWALSRALYRQDDPKDKARGDRWVKERIDSLKKDGPGALLRALKRRRPKTAEQREALRKETGYFSTNRRRMNYPKYLADGMMIGSGPVEAACKVVVGQRMKQSGMRWSDSGADAMLAVRACVLNQDYDKLQKMARAA